MTIEISVVIPTYRRPELLARCLRALVLQSFPADRYEILVADDAANDSTRRQVETMGDGGPPALRYLAVVGVHGPAAARNQGWRHARGELIAFTDDDTIPEPGWLAAAALAFAADMKLAAASGATVVPIPERPTDYERNESGLAHAEFITANCFVRRSALEAIGGFDERFRAAWREDSDLHFSLLERGLPIRRLRDAIVVHPVRPAPWGISLRQQCKSAYDALLYRKHPALFRARIDGVPWKYYAILGSFLAAAIATALRRPAIASVSGAVWVLLTLSFLHRRLAENARTPGHFVEMAVTSLLIPPLSIFWRLWGAVKFRTIFF